MFMEQNKDSNFFFRSYERKTKRTKIDSNSEQTRNPKVWGSIPHEKSYSSLFHACEKLEKHCSLNLWLIC